MPNPGWQEVVAKRNLHSKTFQNPNNPSEYELVSSAGVVHYKAGGLNSADPWLDVDLSNPTDLKALYQLTPSATGIGYTFTPRETGGTVIEITMTNSFVSGAQAIKEYRDNGVIYFPDIATDLDVYMKPTAKRYGIYKVLKSASAVKEFTFQANWSGDPIKLTDENGTEYTGNIRKVLQDGLSGLSTVYFGDGIQIPARVAWDANGKPVPVHVYIKGVTATETVVPDASHVYPITVDTDVSYYATTYDNYIRSSDADYSTAVSGGGTFYIPTTGYAYGIVGQYLDGSTYRLHKGYFPFATGELPDTCTITAATIKIYGVSDSSTQDFNLKIGAYTGDDIIDSDDWDNFSDSGYASFATSGGFSTEGFNSFVLNSDGRTYINKTGDTKFGLYSDRMIPTSYEPSSDEFVMYYSSDFGDSSTDPTIDITYSTGTNVTVTVPSAATASASAPVPTFSLGAGVTAVVSTASAAAVVPSFSLGVGVTSVVASATASALVPSFSLGAGVTAVVSTATAAMLEPSITAIQNVDVSGVVADATAAMLEPGITAIQNTSVTAVLSTATAAALAPVISGDSAVVSLLMTAAAEMLAPGITAVIGVPVLVATQVDTYIQLTW